MYRHKPSKNQYDDLLDEDELLYQNAQVEGVLKKLQNHEEDVKKNTKKQNKQRTIEIVYDSDDLPSYDDVIESPKLYRENHKQIMSPKYERMMRKNDENIDDNLSKSEKWGTKVDRLSKTALTMSPKITKTARPKSAGAISSRILSNLNGERKSSYLEEKEKKENEQKWLENRNRMSMERALNATPPKNLLKLEEQKKKEKEVKNKMKEKELKEYLRKNQFRARDPPKEIYDQTAAEQAKHMLELKEKERKERIANEAMKLLAESHLPPRMEDSSLHFRSRKSSALSAKPQRPCHARDPPNFERLQKEWDDSLHQIKKKNQATVPVEFECMSKKRIEELKKKAEDRLRKQQQEELKRIEKIQRERKQKEMKLQSQIMKEPKPTKTQTLRMKVLQETIESEKIRQEMAIMEEQKRIDVVKRASKAVKEETILSEKKRKEEFGCNYVELKSIGKLANEKAQETKKKFQEAIEKNKERIETAVMNRPTLLQRFEIEKKVAEQKKKALECIAKKVFKGKSEELKKILTPEEQEIVQTALLQEADEKEKKDESLQPEETKDYGKTED